VVAAALLVRPAWADQAQLDRGAYIFTAADCAGCHTNIKANGPLLAGGRPLKTPFGTFYSPNITPDPEHGIGRWTDADFIRALREGVAPDGSHLYPVFPYTSFTRMTDQDMLDLKAYIFSLPTVAQANRAHEIDFPFGWRFTLGAWKLLNFTEGAFAPDPAKDAEWNRGAYLVQALGHCGECHTPRDWLGGLDPSRAFAGTTEGPEGGKVPNITPDPETGIGSWSRADILRVLKTGMLPDFDAVGSAMGEVVQTTSRLTDADRQAIAVYLESLPPLANPEAKATKAD
jgi:mono/diheme cytochrome c family protein